MHSIFYLCNNASNNKKCPKGHDFVLLARF